MLDKQDKNILITIVRFFLVQNRNIIRISLCLIQAPEGEDETLEVGDMFLDHDRHINEQKRCVQKTKNHVPLDLPELYSRKAHGPR